MGLFPVIVGVVDASGNRIDLPLRDGTRPEIQLAIGSGLEGVGALNGEKSVVTLSAPIVTTTTAGIAPRSLGADKVLTTNGSGVATWVPKSSLVPPGKTLLGESEFLVTTHTDITTYTAVALAGNPTVDIGKNALVMTHPGYAVVSASSRIVVEVWVAYGPNSAGTLYIVALHNGGNALRAWPSSSGGGYLDTDSFVHTMASPGIGTFAPTVRMGQVANNNGAFTFNGNAAVGDVFGGAMKSGIRITEWG